MKFFLFYISVISLWGVACTAKTENSVVFSGCHCVPLLQEKLVRISDTLHHYEISVPAWGRVTRNITNDENMLFTGNIEEMNRNGKIKLVGVIEFFDSTSVNIDWEEALKGLAESAEIMDAGTTTINGYTSRWGLVYHKEVQEVYTLNHYIENPYDQRYYYLLSFTIEKTSRYKSRFCELEPILKSFKILLGS